MKAIEEIGIKKSLIFAYYSVVDLFFPIFFIPQLRKLLLVLHGSQVGEGTMLMKIGFFNWHHKGPGSFQIGNDCFIGDQSLIDLYDSVIIGDQVTIAQRVTILTHLNVGYSNHPLKKYFPKQSKSITVKNGSFIGASSTILPGVTIGENSFIAAGSVVISDVPSNKVFGGVPAKFIRNIK